MFKEQRTHTKCPNCNAEMYTSGARMYDATKLKCHKCNKRYIRYWRTGDIIEQIVPCMRDLK